MMRISANGQRMNMAITAMVNTKRLMVSRVEWTKMTTPRDLDLAQAITEVLIEPIHSEKLNVFPRLAR